MVDNKWLDITDTINALGASPKAEKVQSTTKNAVAENKKELTKTGGSANSIL